jgi:hypothetical protein
MYNRAVFGVIIRSAGGGASCYKDFDARVFARRLAHGLSALALGLGRDRASVEYDGVLAGGIQHGGEFFRLKIIQPASK